jgi:hypothetical protein
MTKMDTLQVFENCLNLTVRLLWSESRDVVQSLKVRRGRVEQTDYRKSYVSDLPGSLGLRKKVAEDQNGNASV